MIYCSSTYLSTILRYVNEVILLPVVCQETIQFTHADCEVPKENKFVVVKLALVQYVVPNAAGVCVLVTALNQVTHYQDLEVDIDDMPMQLKDKGKRLQMLVSTIS